MHLSLTSREWLTAIHGMILGAILLLAFAGAFASIYGARRGHFTAEGVAKQLRRIRWGSTIMAILVWAAVWTGSYVIYPWYRAVPPAGADLHDYPKALLVADPNRIDWHNFGMEWKEHIAWFAPIMLTVVAFIVWRYGPALLENRRLRIIAITMLIVAFIAAAVAGVLGALITKAAPVA